MRLGVVPVVTKEVADLGSSGPWKWRALGMADLNHASHGKNSHPI